MSKYIYRHANDPLSAARMEQPAGSIARAPLGGIRSRIPLS